MTVQPAAALRLGEVIVPGDFSSAAPLLVAAAIVPGSDVTVHDLGLNPRRIGLLDVLERMGARVAIFNRRRAGREAMGDVQVEYGELVATRIDAAEVPLLVDELPLVALLASHARGETVVAGATELRLKETDRIAAVADGLQCLRRAHPARTRTAGRSRASRPVSAAARSRRAATTGSRCSAQSQASPHVKGVEIEGAETVAISFPGFYEMLDSLVTR